MQFVIKSVVKGYSTATYPTFDIALEAARVAWKSNPEGVGMCEVHEISCKWETIDEACYCSEIAEMMDKETVNA